MDIQNIFGIQIERQLEIQILISKCLDRIFIQKKEDVLYMAEGDILIEYLKIGINEEERLFCAYMAGVHENKLIKESKQNTTGYIPGSCL